MISPWFEDFLESRDIHLTPAGELVASAATVLLALATLWAMIALTVAVLVGIGG
ncbi:hypothetical protein [Nesterenkonia rhizosphaerae]|uniref:Uncharacterized protein n=1 Tax=Nesterenkonia rhizosphaerae TaxID=1348272 RepID=A0ABP9FT07_9MICC